MESPTKIESNPEPSTTTLIVDLDALDSLAIAINDSIQKAATILSNEFTEEELQEFADTHNMTLEMAREFEDNAISIAETQMEQLPKILSQIAEVRPEVEENDKVRGIYIPELILP